MASTLLTPPRSWADDARAMPVRSLVLSYYRHLPVLPPGRSWRDVERDLERGAWLVRDRGSRSEVFLLGGEEFELRVTRRTARNAAQRGETVWLAVVDRVELARSVPPKAHRLRPEAVRMAEIFEEAGCDLAEVQASVAEREQHLHGARSPHRRADRGSHGELQRAVHKEYGELETLIGLLAERPPPPEAQISGVVTAPDRSVRAETVVVRASAGAGLQEFGRQRVRLATADGRAFHTRVTNTRRDRLEIAEPRDWRARPGTEVTVSVVPPFGMRQNAEALRSFWAGHVEGSWDDLARLLCQPGTLTPLDGPLELTFYADHDPDPRAPRLNAEQRRAVAGAVASPHTFLIQGPPGTGKTEVISEIIRQLTGRGERVLLLAPSHVAVDEALERVGRKPGVRPLRITFSDDKVRESLRAFLPENVGIDTAGRVLRPADSGQEARWEQERRRNAEVLGLIRDLNDAEGRRAQAVADLRAASAEAAQITDRLGARRAGAETELATLGRDAAVSGQALTRSESALALAAQEEQRLHDRWAPLLAAVRDTAVTLVRDGDNATQAHRAERRAVSERDARLADAQVRAESAARARAAAQSSFTAAREAATTARARLSAVRQRPEAASPPKTVIGRFASQLGLGAYAELQRELADAQDADAAAQAQLTARDTALRQARAAHDQLTTRIAADHDRLQSALRRQARAREAAEEEFMRSWQEFTSAFIAAVAANLPSPGRGTEIWQWTRLARTVHTRIGEVLAPGPADGHVDPPASWDGQAAWEVSWAGALEPQLGELSAAAAAMRRLGLERDRASRDDQDKAGRLREAQVWAGAEIERLTNESRSAQAQVERYRAALETAIAERDTLAETLRTREHADLATLERRDHVLGQLPHLAARWRELAAERTDAQLVEDIQQSLVRATNLVCATTKGVVGRGSQVVRHADYDTLIVDEASRVTESEFLIGAIRARRWILVGDEHQLPPHVDADDEHFLHALTALHRAASGRSPSLEQAVKELGEFWQEDEELRKFRDEPVQVLAGELESSGTWQITFADQFAEAHQRFARGTGDNGGDTDRALLGAMIRYLVRSLFQRAVTAVHETLRQPLVWQRRMIAPLAEVVNMPVYRGRYKSPSEADLAAANVTPLVTPVAFPFPCTFIDTSHYLDAEENPDRHGFYNKREIQLVTRVCEIYNSELAERRGAAAVSTSVLSFYSAQAQRLRQALLPRDDLPMLDWKVIDVVDRIQGQQSDLVIISFTRARRGHFSARYGQWLMDTRRLNVACTRARRALVLVGHADTLRRLGGHATDQQTQRAREFYRNLFGLIESNEHFMLKVKL